MGNYFDLIAAINAAIKTNGEQGITGASLNAILRDMVAALGAGYQYVGVVAPDAAAPSTDYNAVYLGLTAGTYTNFGGTQVRGGQFGVFTFNGSWTYNVADIASGTFVRCDGEQELPEGEKENARNNIDAASKAEVNAKYTKPSGGIPKTDLALAVQTSLGKADSALPASDVVDNLTTEDATKALSAKQGKVLDNEVSRLGQEVNGINVSYDNSILTNGAYIDSSDGTEKTNSYRSRTDFLEIEPGAKLVFKVYGSSDPANQGYALYDASKQYVSGEAFINAEVNTKTIASVPDNVKYIRISFVGSSNASFGLFSFVETLPGIAVMRGNIEDIQQDVEDLSGDFSTLEASVTDTKDTVDALVDYDPEQKKQEDDFLTIGLYKAGVAEIDSSYTNYRSIPLIYVAEGQEIVFHDWQKGSALASVAAVFCYDNDGLPFYGSSARRNYADMQTKDYTTGEYTFKVPANCSQIGLAFNFTAYPVGSDAYIKIGEEKYELTDLAKELINNAVEQGNEVGDDSAKYYLKGNSNIVYSPAKKLGIIAAGQSNIDGRNSYSDLPAGFVNPNAKVRFCNNTNGTFADFQVTDGGSNNDWSFDAIVYDLLTKSAYGNQSEIFVMKHSMGGTSIDPLGATEYHWTADYEFLDSPSNSLLRTFETIVRKGVELQGANFDIKAMLWHQGEGDMQNEAVASRYYENLKNMLAYVRGVVGNPRLYFFCGNISLNRTSPGYVNIINAAYTKIASEDPYFKVVDMSNAQLEDGYHFNYQWSIYFGQKVYDLMIDAGIITGTKINPSEPS